MRTGRWGKAAVMAVAWILGFSSAVVAAAPAQTETRATPTRSAVKKPCGVSAKPASWDHVVWIVMENHGSAQTVGSPDAPYFNSLINKCGLATNVSAITHPSLPNYLAMTSGSTQGVVDNAAPAAHPLTAPSIFSQLGSGRWRTLAESMPSNCYRYDSGDYAVRHNPATYYTNIAAQCAKQNMRLGRTPKISSRFTLVVPNNKSNTHDTAVSYGDHWLSRFVPKLLKTPEYRAGRTAVFITYDEDSGAENNHIPMVVLAPSVAAGTKDGASYTLYSMLRTTEEMLGLGLLENAATANSMRGGFHL